MINLNSFIDIACIFGACTTFNAILLEHSILGTIEVVALFKVTFPREMELDGDVGANG